uniref:Putative secreted protein n=1 Tax=Anopheles triannulatus TaxID=58253 RepID=A0A2M4B4A2_9DIPT
MRFLAQQFPLYLQPLEAVGFDLVLLLFFRAAHTITLLRHGRLLFGHFRAATMCRHDGHVVGRVGWRGKLNISRSQQRTRR